MPARRLMVTAGALVCLVAFSAAHALAAPFNPCNPPDADPCVVSTIVSVPDGATIDLGDRTLQIANLGSLAVGAGTMTIQVGQLVVDAGGSLTARAPQDTGGTILVTAGTITINGSVDASGGEAGLIDFESLGTITVNGPVFADAIPIDGSGNEVILRAQTINVGAAGVVRSIGRGEGCGGDLTIEAFGDVTVAGTMDGSGGEGGSVGVVAGAMMMSGNLTVAATGRINATGNVAAACGGTVSLAANGDGAATGQVVIDGQLNASAPNGNLEDGGGAGGSIDITADGSIISTSTMARFIAVGSGPDGEGGTIDLSTPNGSMTLPGRADFGSPGVDSGGGCFTVTAHGDVEISGTLDGVAGSNTSGEVVVISSNGSIDVKTSASIDVSASMGGDAGVITLRTMGLDSPATIDVAGRLRASGGTVSGLNAGFAGLVEIEASDSATIASGALIEALTRGPVSNIQSGTGVFMLSVTRGPAAINGSASVAGTGTGAPGGRISVDATALTGIGTLNAGGQGAPAGSISIETAGRVSWSGMINAAASGLFPGGTVEVVTENGDFNLRGTIRTDGNSSASVADVNIVACELIIENTGVISSQQTDGENVLTGRQGTAVFGTLRAGTRNLIRYNIDPPVIFSSAVVVPTAQEIFDGSITPCNVPPTPTPSMCVGDCNHDGKVSVDELVRGVDIALDLLPLSSCPEFAPGGGDTVTLPDLVQAVAGSLHGCL